jgi:hypothetical protein
LCDDPVLLGCVEPSDGTHRDQEVFVSHADAALTPRARLRLARLIVEQGCRLRGPQSGSRSRGRLPNAEIHDDETTATAISVLRRAVDWFAARGVRPARILTDNDARYRAKT